MSASAYRTIACLCGCLMLLLMGCSDPSEKIHLRLAHSLDPSHTVHRAMQYMGERLALHSGGQMVVDIYPSGQLGNERELIELLQLGVLSMTKVSASPLEGFVPKMKIFNIPYLYRDHQHYLSVLDSPIGKRLLDEPVSVRLRGLGYYDAGSRSFYTTEKPIYTPLDLKGQKIRVQQSQTAMQMISAFGGAPTPISWGELYTALQQGVVDGAENNPPSFYRSGHYEVAKYFTLDEHTAVPDVLLCSEYLWRRLNDKQRAWLKLAVEESVAFQRGLWQEDTELALKAAEAAGVEIIRPDKAAFADQVKDMHQAHAGTEVGELIKQIKAYH